MKKLLCAIPVLACAVLAACGAANGGAITENSDPYAIEGEKVSEETWSEVFSDRENYCVKTVIETTPTEKEDTMPAKTTIVTCFDDENAHVTMTAETSGKVSFEAEAYVRREAECSLWQRTKENGSWSEWEGRNISSAEAEGILGGKGLAFVKTAFSEFEYGEEELGYAAKPSGLETMQSDLCAFAEGILAQAPSSPEAVTVESFVLKINDRKPSACLLELSGDLSSDSMQTPRRFPDLIEPHLHIRIPLRPYIKFPRLILEFPAFSGAAPMPRTASAPKISVAQIYYGYGETDVSLPDWLPSLDGD